MAAVETLAPPPTAMTMSMSAKTARVKLHMPGKPVPTEFSLGPTVRARDLMGMVHKCEGCPTTHQQLYHKGTRVKPDTELCSLLTEADGEVLELNLVYGGLNGGGDEGCHCCGMHCAPYLECKMRICCFFHGCDLLFNKLQLFCCSWQYAPCEAPECLCQCVTRICCCVGGCDTKCNQCQFYCCKFACCGEIDQD